MQLAFPRVDSQSSDDIGSQLISGSGNLIAQDGLYVAYAATALGFSDIPASRDEDLFLTSFSDFSAGYFAPGSNTDAFDFYFLEPTGVEDYHYILANGDQTLAVQVQTCVVGENIFIADHTGSPKEMWRFISVGTDGYYQIQNKYNGLGDECFTRCD